MSEHKWKEAYLKGYEAGKKDAFSGYCEQCYDELSRKEQVELMIECGANKPVRLGKWKKCTYNLINHCVFDYECEYCKQHVTFRTAYCPYCGMPMEISINNE